MKLDIPKFNTLKEKIAFIVDNKASLISQKCAEVKHADGFGFTTTLIGGKPGVSDKATPSGNAETGDLKVKVIINTTNIMDSHSDVHIKGIWNKSIRENKRIMHIQEHKSYSFDKIIASGNDVVASTKTYTWKELGYDAEGETQALVFDSIVKEKRNPFMYDQYKNGYVDNHSVGMRYVKLELAVNDKDYKEEKAVWDNYIDQVVNRDYAEQKGYFWAVTEAKIIEGSAVPNGSNPITPTQQTSEVKNEENNEEDLNKQAMKSMEDWLFNE